MDDMITKALVYLFIGLINVGIGYLIKLAKKHRIIQDLRTKKELVEIAVSAVQEVYGNSDGEKKFEEAKKWVLNSAKNVGLKVSEKEVEYLIESVLINLKKQLGDVWHKK